jgi:hypothetical protein
MIAEAIGIALERLDVEVAGHLDLRGVIPFQRALLAVS